MPTDDDDEDKDENDNDDTMIVLIHTAHNLMYT